MARMNAPIISRTFAGLVLSLALSVASAVRAADPQVDSWMTRHSGRYARIYESDTARTNGVSRTTWTNGTTIQALPAYVGVQEIYSSPNWLYVRTTGLGLHTMGPWYLNAAHTQAFPGWPVNQKALYRIPRSPATNGTHTLTSLGAIGYSVDGVALFDTQDGAKWTGSAESQMGGTGYWYRDAYINEGVTFDPANAHQPGSGQHHYHANPIALRYLLGDHVDFNSATKIYTESAEPVTKHSPILGWMADGFPIYGPYGHSSATNANSGLRRMVGGYVLRDGQYGTQNLTASGRSSIPKWAARAYGTATNVQAGPAVSTTYPLGRYMEDKDYLGDLGYTQGVDFDLNEWNTRWCVTPEFPKGTWAYFVAINSDGSPAYPYNIGRSFFGTPTGGAVGTPSETVATNFVGGPVSAPTLGPPSVGNGRVTLTWSATEGGRYRVESTPDFGGWKTNATDVSATLDTAAYTGAAPDGSGFYRVARTSLATYDPATGTTTTGGGDGGAIVRVSPTTAARGTTFTLTVTLPNTAPPAMAPILGVTVGTITGTGNFHVSQTSVTSSIALPAGTAVGTLDVSVKFPGPPENPAATETYTLAGGVTVF